MADGIWQPTIESFSADMEMSSINPHMFPHNEGQNQVRKIVFEDIESSKEISIVAGYASLDELLILINEKRENQKLRILIGNEPSVGSLTEKVSTHRSLAEDTRRYWIEERNISITHTFTLLNAFKKIENEEVVVRINNSSKVLHAKVFATDEAVIIGSSNFTKPGLRHQREFNSRLIKERDSDAYNQSIMFVDGCFRQSDDYREELLQLLNELIRRTTWKEALACACWDMLDGMGSDEFLAQFKLDQRNLWPHQIQGVAQGMNILREQGSVLVADSTGSGKTRTGLWLMAASDSMIRRSQQDNPLCPDPVLVVPKGVEKDWKKCTRMELKRTPEVLTHGVVSKNYAENSEGRDRQDRLDEATVVLIDEAHNFYNDSNRTLRIRSHGAQSAILLTATPINRKFDDIISLVELLSQDELDEELERTLRGLRKSIYSNNNVERTKARKKAAEVVQRFTVRRTRFELNRIAQRYPSDYQMEGRQTVGFPQRRISDYQVEINRNDIHHLDLIRTIVSNINGLAFLPSEIKLTEIQREYGTSDERIIKQTLSLAKAGAGYKIWSALSSSPAASYEHVAGTENAMSHFDIPDFKEKPSVIPEKLENLRMPVWSLDESSKELDSVPAWMIDEEEFRKEVADELTRYDAIANQLVLLSDSLIDSRAAIILEHFKNAKKILAFDWHLISLQHLKKRLISQGIDEGNIFIFDSKNKSKAEKYFGLESSPEPAIGLCSDSLNEGINLQGANVLVNLDRPTTIRRYEQRMGRVDRMNSRFDEIEVLMPILPLEIGNQLRDHLTERLELVREVFGGNDKENREIGLSGTDEIYDDESAETHPSFVVEDAFSPIRSLVGDDGLISDDEYMSYAVPNTRARAEVCVLESKTPWCFFVLQSSWNSGLKWALIKFSGNSKLEVQVITELGEICLHLRENLDDTSIEPKDEKKADYYVQKYIEELENKRDLLIPKRYRNALMLGVTSMARIKSTLEKSNSELYNRFRDIQIQFGAQMGHNKNVGIRHGEEIEHQIVDRSALAESWMRKIKPIKKAALRNADRRSTTKTRRERFLKELSESPISIEEAEQLVANLPLQQPISDEIKIIIAGVPRE